jgi:hypothetical protein
MEDHRRDDAPSPLHQPAQDQPIDQGVREKDHDARGVLNLNVERGEDDGREQIRRQQS